VYHISKQSDNDFVFYDNFHTLTKRRKKEKQEKKTKKLSQLLKVHILETLG